MAATFWPQLIWWVGWLPSAFPFPVCHLFGRHKLGQGADNSNWKIICTLGVVLWLLRILRVLPLLPVHTYPHWVVVFGAPLDERSEWKINSNLFRSTLCLLVYPLLNVFLCFSADSVRSKVTGSWHLLPLKLSKLFAIKADKLKNF